MEAEASHGSWLPAGSAIESGRQPSKDPPLASVTWRRRPCPAIKLTGEYSGESFFPRAITKREEIHETLHVYRPATHDHMSSTFATYYARHHPTASVTSTGQISIAIASGRQPSKDPPLASVTSAGQISTGNASEPSDKGDQQSRECATAVSTSRTTEIYCNIRGCNIRLKK
jgi:hypothetical protein